MTKEQYLYKYICSLYYEAFNSHLTIESDAILYPLLKAHSQTHT